MDEAEAKVAAHRREVEKIREKYESEKRLTKNLRSYKRKYRELEDYVNQREYERIARQEEDISNFINEQKILSRTERATLPGRYKTAMCRYYHTPEGCYNGNNCTFAHSYDELQ